MGNEEAAAHLEGSVFGPWSYLGFASCALPAASRATGMRSGEQQVLESGPERAIVDPDSADEDLVSRRRDANQRRDAALENS